jgi:hypothetical protein
MTPADLPLRDIHLPPAPGWWPPAPGWWAGALIAAAACAAALYWRRRRRRPRDAVAEARRLLDRLRDPDPWQEPARQAAELSALLRRVCVSRWPRAEVASLTGEAWLAFLDRVSGGDGFTRGGGRLLIEAPYRPMVTEPELAALLDLGARWLDAVAARPPGAAERAS